MTEGVSIICSNLGKLFVVRTSTTRPDKRSVRHFRLGAAQFAASNTKIPLYIFVSSPLLCMPIKIVFARHRISSKIWGLFTDDPSSPINVAVHKMQKWDQSWRGVYTTWHTYSGTSHASEQWQVQPRIASWLHAGKGGGGSNRNNQA
jgi:hypothetical protein